MSSILEHKYSAQIPTILGKDSQLRGNIKFSHAARMAGGFEGNVESNAFLIIEPSAIVRAKVLAQDIVISGEIHGDVVAQGTVELLPGARVYGNIKTNRIRICDGVVFDGKCEMIHNVQNLDIFSAPIRELRKSIHLAEEQN